MNKSLLYTRLVNWKFLLSILISLLFSFFAFQNFKLNDLLILLSEINYLIIFSGIILLLFSVYIRALRWQLLFNKKNIKIKLLFDSELIGYFGNNILPLRLGEILRCVIVSKKTNLKKTYIFGTVVLERFLDMCGVLIVCVMLLFLGQNILIDFILEYKLIYIFLSVLFILILSLKINGTRDRFISKSKIVIIF